MQLLIFKYIFNNKLPSKIENSILYPSINSNYFLRLSLLGSSPMISDKLFFPLATIVERRGTQLKFVENSLSGNVYENSLSRSISKIICFIIARHMTITSVYLASCKKLIVFVKNQFLKRVIKSPSSLFASPK